MSTSQSAQTPATSPATAAPPAASTYPTICKGASLLLAWRLDGKRVLLVGGGAVAASRLGFLLESGAHVTIVSPSPLEPSIAHRVSDSATSSDITWHDRAYLGESDPLPVSSFDMALTAIDDVVLSRAVCQLARQARVPVNVADVPPECDFYFGAQLRRGPLQVMVSTSGQGPKIAVMVRDIVKAAVPDNVEDAIAGVGALRAELRARAPGVGGELSKRRMEWMISTCNAWTLAQMGAMRNDQVRAQLLDEGWDKRRVLGPSDVAVSAAADTDAGGQTSTLDTVRRSLVAVATPATWAAGAGGLVIGAAMATIATLYVLKPR